MAAVEAGFAIGLADAAIAMGRLGERLPAWRDRMLFAPSLGGLCALALALGALCVAGVGRALSRVRPSVRPTLVQLGAIAAGLAGGFALFSGTAMRRSSARPWAILATAALAALVAQLAWSSRGRIADAAARRPATARVALALGSVALYVVHAFAYVRLYAGLHAIAATSAAALLVVSLGLRAGEPAPRSATPVALFALLAGLLGATDLLRSGAQRALAHAHAPLGSYVVQALGRLAPRAHVRAVVRDDRFAAGRHFDLRGLDVVLVTVDALRADQLGAYGGPAGLTPALDALARDAVVIDRAYCTTPHTSYSLASLMTSKYSRPLAQLGIAMRPSATLAGELERVGYASAAFYPPAVWSVDAEQVGDLRARAFGFGSHREGYEDAQARVDAVAAWLDAHPLPRRVFVWVHFFEPHEPYERHAGARCCAGDAPRARYATEVSAVDDAVGRLRALFVARGRRAAWIATADHGEEFGEHGGRFHGTTVYDEQVRVPLLIAVPGAPTGHQSGPASLVDVMPTVLAGLGIPRPSRLRGRDLGPMVHGDEGWDGEVYASAGTSRMVVRGHDKLIWDVTDGACELYDLAADPREQANLVDARPGELGALRGLLEGWQASQARFEREADDPGAPVRPELAQALQGDSSAAPAVAALLDGADVPTALAAAGALARLGVRDAFVRDALARALLRPDRALALEAGVDLALLGDARGAAAAREALGSSDVVLARRGALGLARLGAADGVPLLGDWLRDPHASDAERDAAVGALRGLRDPRAFATWLALLDDPRLAPAAAEALGALGDARAVGPLERTADTTRYALTRRAALGALARLEPAQARARLAAAVGLPEGLPDAFALAAQLHEPGVAITGTTRAVAIPARAAHATRATLEGPSPPRGPAVLVLAFRSRARSTLRINGERVDVAAGGSQVSLAVDRPSRTLWIERVEQARDAGTERTVELVGAMLVAGAR